MAAVAMSGIEAVVFDLFGTLVYEFPRADWEGWLETSAAILEADVDAFKAAWQATGIERQTGRLGDLEENLRTVAARAGAWPTDAQLTEILDGRAAMYRKWFVPRPGAEEILARLRAQRLSARADQHVRARGAGDVARVAARGDRRRRGVLVRRRAPQAGPEIYLLATKRLGLSPLACLYVGEGSYRELSGAAAVGMRPVLIRDPQEEAEMLRPEVEAWDGASIDDLRRVPDLLEA